MAYIHVNENLLNNDNLSLSEKMVLAILESFQTEPFFGSDAYLAKTLKLSIGRIKNILTKLSKLGLIIRERIKYTRYIFTSKNKIRAHLPVDNSVDNFDNKVTQSHDNVTLCDVNYNIYTQYSSIHPAGVYKGTASPCSDSFFEQEEDVTPTSPQPTPTSLTKVSAILSTLLERKQITLDEKTKNEVAYYAQKQNSEGGNVKSLFKYLNVGLKLVKEGRWRTPFTLQKEERKQYQQEIVSPSSFIPEWTAEYKAEREQELVKEKQQYDATQEFHVAEVKKEARKRNPEFDKLLEASKRW